METNFRYLGEGVYFHLDVNKAFLIDADGVCRSCCFSSSAICPFRGMDFLCLGESVAGSFRYLNHYIILSKEQE